MRPATHKSPSVSFLVLVYVGLMVLLALTVLAAHGSLGPLALLVALGIAALKSLLVMLYFMHVRYSSRVTWVFVIAGFLWLLILFSLTFAEYAGRTRIQRTPGFTYQDPGI